MASPHRALSRPRGIAMAWAAAAAIVFCPPARGAVSFTSPGLPESRLDDQGRLVEDWGAIGVRVTGEGLSPAEAPTVTRFEADGVIPTAIARSRHGSVNLARTAFRAPVWPGGLDVFTVRLEETAGRETPLQLSLDLPETVRLGAQSVSVGGRLVVALPPGVEMAQELREWGWSDDAVALPGWARPRGECDPAFRNIRAGLGGVPIRYRFTVEPRSGFNVVLGFCESHWTQAGQRPVVCEVEGASTQEFDPLARWGQHGPGAVAFNARDVNGDGWLEVGVLPKAGAPDRNPILNGLWLFPAGWTPDLDQVVAGRLSRKAARYVDVGGTNDQSLHAGGKVDYALVLPAKGVRELTFLVACPGGAVPMPDQTAWTPEKLRRAAAEVWRGWAAR